MLGCALDDHLICIFDRIIFVSQFVMAHLKIVLPTHLIFEHPIQICMRNSKFTLHICNNLLEGVFLGDSSVSSCFKLVLETIYQ